MNEQIKAPVIVTDVRYRTSLAVIRPLNRAGYPVWAVQTQAESPKKPAAFFSRCTGKTIMLPGSVKDPEYGERLLRLCKDATQGIHRPVLFPIGAGTLAVIARRKQDFESVCDVLVPDLEILDAANDKRLVAQAAAIAGVPTPQEFDWQTGLPSFPAIIKPRCGEKLGLHAEDRYQKVYNEAQYHAALDKMRHYDKNPVVQELVEGAGAGVCLVMDRECRPVTVICHRRIREYPITGGPSACCVSFYDESLVNQAVHLLQVLRFTGIAMVEFKGDRVLEINPRIWGSFPLTDACGSRFAENYVRAASGEIFSAVDTEYCRGQKMRFILNDTLSILSHLKKGHLKQVSAGIADIFRAKEALFRWYDQRPFWRYLRLTLTGKG